MKTFVILPNHTGIDLETLRGCRPNPSGMSTDYTLAGGGSDGADIVRTASCTCAQFAAAVKRAQKSATIHAMIARDPRDLISQRSLFNEFVAWLDDKPQPQQPDVSVQVDDPTAGGQ